MPFVICEVCIPVHLCDVLMEIAIPQWTGHVAWLLANAADPLLERIAPHEEVLLFLVDVLLSSHLAVPDADDAFIMSQVR